VRVSPAPSHQVPVPSQEGLRPDEETSSAGHLEQPAQPRQNSSVRRPQGGTNNLAAQDSNLVTEHDDLNDQVLLPTA
jgi:hypothetical protein